MNYLLPQITACQKKLAKSPLKMISLAPIPIAKLIARPTAASSASSKSIIALPLQLNAAMSYQLSSRIKTPTQNVLRSLNIAPSKFILKDNSYLCLIEQKCRDK